MLQVQVLGPDKTRLQQMCRVLVDDHLIACGQVLGPVQSVYRWRGEIEEVTEWIALLKTTPVALNKVIDRLRIDHPGDLPEIIATPVVAGLTAYLDWVQAEVTGGA
jgi:periplasmic divalent cation tolerance protein